MATAKLETSLPGRKARAKDPQHPKILGSRTKESQTPPVATSRRRGPQIPARIRKECTVGLLFERGIKDLLRAWVLHKVKLASQGEGARPPKKKKTQRDTRHETRKSGGDARCKSAATKRKGSNSETTQHSTQNNRQTAACGQRTTEP